MDEQKNMSVNADAAGADSGTGETGNEIFAGGSVTETDGKAAAGVTAEGSGTGGNTDAPDAGQGDGTEGTEAQDAAGKVGKTAENATAAERRRVAEQRRTEIIEREKTRAAEAARVSAVIEMLDGVNPYTKKPMKDAQDVAVYMRQREIEKKGGDPVTGYADYLAEEARRAESEAQTREASEKWFSDDLAAFAAAHPDIKPDELLTDPDFGMYAEGKVGKLPLSEIYESYAAMLDKQRAAAQEKADAAAAQKLANAQAAAGSARGRGEDPGMTKARLMKMSVSEVSKYKQENPAEYRRLMNGS